MPSPTNRYMNTSSVGWTPSGGSLAPLTGIKSISQADNMEALKESADFDVFHTTGGVTMVDPTITLHTIDAFALYATVAGATGTLVATIRDFTNGAVTAQGAKILTLSNAFLMARSREAQYRQLAHQQLSFCATSTDGATNPLAIAAA